MRFFKNLVSSFSVLCLFGCSNNNDEQDRQDLLKWINYQLIEVTTEIESDISKEKRGFYPHPGKSDYKSKGYIDIVLNKKNGARLDISKHSTLTIIDIQHTEGYKHLLERALKFNAQISIKQVLIDGDEVETMEELDEYIDDPHHYYVITLSGWQPDLEV